MKTIRRLWLCLAFLLASLPSALRADNLTWETATLIYPDEAVVTTFSDNVAESESRWYRLEVEEGAWYEIPFTNYPFEVYSHSQEGLKNRYQTDDFESQYNDSDPKFRAIQIRAKKATTLYISVTYRPEMTWSSNPLAWRIEKITDNRVWGNALPFYVGDDVAVEGGQNTRWYYVPLSAGKNYFIRSEELGVTLYYSKQGQSLTVGKNNLFQVEANESYYVVASGATHKAGKTFRIEELPTPTNTTPDKAQTIQLGNDYTYVLQLGPDFYYNVELEKDKCYEVVSNNLYLNSTLNVTTPSAQPIDMEDVHTRHRAYMIEATETGNYLLHTGAPRWQTAPPYSATAFTFKVEEVKDARFWRNAIPLELDKMVTNLPAGQLRQWQKIDLQGGSTYGFHLVGDGVRVELYEEGYLSKPAHSFDKPMSYTAQKTSTYYLLSATDYNISNDGQLTISLLQAVTNVSAEKALRIEVGDSLVADMSDYSDLYYKVELKGGEVYEIEVLTGSSYLSSMYVRNEKSQLIIASSSRGQNSLIFAPKEDGTYLIDMGQWSPIICRWTLQRITDNRVMQYALPVEAGNTYTVAAEDNYPNGQNWYRLATEKGVIYEIDCTANIAEDILEVHADSLQEQPYIARTEKYLFKANEAGVYYFCVKRQNNAQPFTFSVWHRRGDNRLADYAQDIALNEEVQCPHHTLRHGVLWYKLELEGGKAYELTSSSSQAHTLMYRLDKEKNKLEALGVFKTLRNELIYVPQTATYYFESRMVNQSYPLNNSSANYSWRIIEKAGDNRLPQFAEPLTLGTAFKANFYSSHTRWYKVDLQAGGLYELTEERSIFAENIDWYLHYDSVAIDDIYKKVGRKGMLMPKVSGTFYLRLKTSGSSMCNYTLTEVKDNRTCQYAKQVSIGADRITDRYMPTTGLWFAIEMVQGKYYQFNTSKMGGFQVALYKSCGEEQPFFQSKVENALYAPSQSGSYLLHVSRPNYPESTAAWELPTTILDTGDDRLCQFAIPMTDEQGCVVSTEGGKYTHWYTVAAKKGKWYRVELKSANTNKGSGLITLYNNCGDEAPIIGFDNSSGIFSTEEDATIYLRVKTQLNGQTLRWYEVDSTGMTCATALPMEVGKTVTTLPTDGNNDGYQNTTWYHFIAPITGRYHLHLDEFNHEVREQSFWNVAVSLGCSEKDPNIAGQLIEGAGHWGNNGSDIEFDLEAGKEYTVQVNSFLESASVDHTWRISIAKQQDCTLEISLVNAGGDALQQMEDAVLTLYQKTDDGIHLCDTLRFEKSTALFIAEHLNHGAYLLHFQAGSSAAEHYLPVWYTAATRWEDATEIVINTKRITLSLTPPSASTPIMGTGNVTLEGSVESVLNENESISNEGIGINLYRAIANAGAPVRHSTNATLLRAKSISTNEWQFVARTYTDAHGKYRIEELPKGTYMLLVDLPGFSAEEAKVVVEAQEEKVYDAPSFVVNPNDKTIVTSLPTLSIKQPVDTIYDLSGRRRSTLQQGINIVGNRKVILK